MEIYLTSQGRKNLESKIADLYKDLKKIREEKKIAYTASGDCWHDNPGFNALEQREKKIAENIAENSQMLQSANFIDIQERCLTEVRLGSIVGVERYFHKTDELREEIWEIVGYGESDPEKYKIVYNSPLAGILLNMKLGDVKTVKDSKKGDVDHEVVHFYKNWGECNRKEK
jgi:transcription elongation factor GreA